MTRLFGVIGDPIDHSCSPAKQTAALQALRVDACYTAIEVPRRFLRPMLRALVLAGVEGLNVTVPLKEAVVPLLDRIDPMARAIGAVNTIVVQRRRTIGYNTDGLGLRLALRELGWRPRAARAVILGAGGAARAAAWELSRASGSCVAIANRHPARARALVRWLSAMRPRACVCAVPLHRLPLAEADVLINATTVGLRPGDGGLVDPRQLHRGLLVYDLIAHRDTPLVQAARRRGCVAANGRNMLLYQGAESLRLWLRRRPPLQAMRRALTQALARPQSS